MGGHPDCAAPELCYCPFTAWLEFSFVVVHEVISMLEQVWALGSCAFGLLGLETTPYERADSCMLPSEASGTSLVLSVETRGLVERMLSWEASTRPAALTAVAWLHVRARMLVRQREHERAQRVNVSSTRV